VSLPVSSRCRLNAHVRQMIISCVALTWLLSCGIRPAPGATQQQADCSGLLFRRQLETVASQAEEFIGWPGRSHQTGQTVDFRSEKKVAKLMGQRATQCPTNQNLLGGEGGGVQPRCVIEHTSGGGSRQVDRVAGTICVNVIQPSAPSGSASDCPSPIVMETAEWCGASGRLDTVPIERDVPIERNACGSPDGLRLSADSMHQRVRDAARGYYFDRNGRDSWLTGKPQKVHHAQHDHDQVLRRHETRHDDWGEIVSGYKRGAREIIPRDHREGEAAPKSLSPALKTMGQRVRRGLAKGSSSR
jgi:hypothetical protein